MTNMDTPAAKSAVTPAVTAERVRHIRDTASLDDDTPWLVVATTPVAPIAPTSGSEPGSLIEFVRGEVASWPAPIPLASDPPSILDDRVVFSPAHLSDTAGGRYHAEFHSDGSAIVAIAVGSRRTQSLDSVVWAIGEGAVAWIVIAALRLTAAYADRVAAIDEVCVEATITSPRDTMEAPLEIWNRDQRGYAPTGQRCTELEPVSRLLAPSACLSADLAGVARPLIAGMLHQFGLAGDRHIDSSGILRRSRFVGFENRILAWADAIGVASRL